jgi:hypothetical protein
MSLSAKLYVDNKEYNILSLRMSMTKEVSHQGNPKSNFVGGFFDLEIESTKDNTMTDWMLSPNALKDAKIIIPDRFGTGSSREIELKDVYCIEHNESFEATTTNPMTTSFRLSPGGMYLNGKEGYVKYWHEKKPVVKNEPKEEEKEKKVTLLFEANNSDVRKGLFGYDKLPDDYKKICTSNIVALENEYKPLQVYGEKYYPIWVSMRKGQTITLKIDTVKRKNYKLFENIKFNATNDFTFEPANLKDANEIQITCNNNNPTPTQIKVEGDGEVVGAINFFYPEPKTVKLDWRFVEITGNGKDDKILKSKITADKLKKLFEKAFKPMLIDISLDNTLAKIADLTSQKELLEKSGILVNGSTNYIQSERKSVFVSLLEQSSTPSSICITLYLVNRNCMDTENATTEEGVVGYVAGFSRPNSGIAYGIMMQNNMLPEAIAHEIMHALGLQHTFKDGKHTFKAKSTKNYMDYSASKDNTYKWQWEIARNNLLLQ